MPLSSEPSERDYPFRVIPEPTQESLEAAHARASADYETWKHDFIAWLDTEGKDPERLTGYSDSTVRQANYKVDQIMRWLWRQRGYTTEVTGEDADAFMRELGRHSDDSDANLNTYVKTFKRLFKYFNREKGRSIEWECQLELSEPKVTNRDYFKKREFRPL